MRVNGAAFVAYDGARVVSAGDAYTLRETVENTEGDSRAFSTSTVTVSGIAPTATGGVADQTFTLNEAITPLDVAADFTGSAPITYALAPASDALPAGLSLSSAGEISGTPTEEVGPVNIEVRGTNADGSDDTAFEVTVEAAFTPANLFTSGTGVFYDVQDLSSMNTEPDQSGSTPTVGDAVRFIADKSGGGNNAKSSSLAASPVLRQDGNGKYYLEFDGVDDVLVTDQNVNVTGSSPREYIGGIGSTGFVFTINLAGGTGERWTVRGNNNDLNVRVEITGSSYVSALPSDGVVGIRLLPGGTLGDHILSHNTTDENATGTAPVVTTAGPLNLGRTNTTFFREMQFYGCVFIDRVLNATERLDTREYFADARGITI